VSGGEAGIFRRRTVSLYKQPPLVKTLVKTMLIFMLHPAVIWVFWPLFPPAVNSISETEFELADDRW
jgi:hypothetical protein